MMRDQLIPQERVLAICREVVNKQGEFYYDGGILDQSSKYSDIVI